MTTRVQAQRTRRRSLSPFLSGLQATLAAVAQPDPEKALEEEVVAPVGMAPMDEDLAPSPDRVQLPPPQRADVPESSGVGALSAVMLARFKLLVEDDAAAEVEAQLAAHRQFVKVSSF